MWVRDYHVDGLRLDAVHALFDDSPRHVLAELAERVREARPGALVISEMEIGNLAPIGTWGHDAQWDDRLHHAVHVLLTGEREGYYAEFGRVAQIAEAYEEAEPEKRVVCIQNHDQVGNRALGDRLQGQDLRLGAFVVHLSPGTPLLFMGEEYGETNPFQFFTDHIDPAIAEATREGRKREFAAFSAFSGQEPPDPQAEETFLRSKLDRSHADPATQELYRRLLEVRRELPPGPARTALDEDARWFRAERGPYELLANFGDGEVRLPTARGEVVLETGGATLDGGDAVLPFRAAVLLR
jgi:maltooligosyltrehalose trehalohydrolase